MSDQAERLRERVKAQGIEGGTGRGRALAARDRSAGASAALAERPPAGGSNGPSILGVSGELPVWGGAGVDLPVVLTGLAEALGRHGSTIVPVTATSEVAARVFVSRTDPAAVMAAYRAMAASAEGGYGASRSEASESEQDRWRGLWLVTAQGYPGGSRVAQAVKAAAHAYRGLHVTYLGTLPVMRRGRFPAEADLAFSTAALRVQAVWGGEAT